MHKAVFLDRDGTIVEDVGYMNSPHQIRFIPGALEAIRLLNQADFKVVIISNQSGVARGLLTEGTLKTLDKAIKKRALSAGALIDGSYYCPHHPEHGFYPYGRKCECRKPGSGMIKQAEREMGIDLLVSFIIGDKATDIESGKRANTKAVLVMTGYGENEKNRLLTAPDHIAADCLAAVNWILAGK